jgi:cytoskeletal protein CcmA (bactofilin family)
MLTLFRKLIPGKAEGAPDENFFISAGLQFYGDLVAKASSGRIEGKFDGQIIECKKLIIGANATIKGNIFAHDILVYGYCEGNIYASGDIKVFDGAVVLGDIHSSSLFVDRNATFRGNLRKLKPEDYAEMTATEKDRIIQLRKSNVYNIHSLNVKLDVEKNKARLVANGTPTVEDDHDLTKMKKVSDPRPTLSESTKQEKFFEPGVSSAPDPLPSDDNKRWF